MDPNFHSESITDEILSVEFRDGSTFVRFKDELPVNAIDIIDADGVKRDVAGYLDRFTLYVYGNIPFTPSTLGVMTNCYLDHPPE
jgi:hypothetical protein